MSRILVSALAVLFAIGSVAVAEENSFVGVKACVKCHDLHGESWATTTHAKAFESLKPGARKDAKVKAKLDPNKDYTADEQCVGCHSTGFGKPGGYELGAKPGGKRMLGSVGCESCHGPGGSYRRDHGKAEKAFKRGGAKAARAVLTAAGQNFDYEQACAACHLNYQGGPHPQVKVPFTPFTPEVDPKYAFDYVKSVRESGDGKPMHAHYKLKGIFEGDPIPDLREELQKTAKEIPY